VRVKRRGFFREGVESGTSSRKRLGVHDPRRKAGGAADRIGGPSQRRNVFRWKVQASAAGVVLA